MNVTGRMVSVLTAFTVEPELILMKHLDGDCAIARNLITVNDALIHLITYTKCYTQL